MRATYEALSCARGGAGRPGTIPPSDGRADGRMGRVAFGRHGAVAFVGQCTHAGARRASATAAETARASISVQALPAYLNNHWAATAQSNVLSKCYQDSMRDFIGSASVPPSCHSSCEQPLKFRALLVFSGSGMACVRSSARDRQPCRLAFGVGFWHPPI